MAYIVTSPHTHTLTRHDTTNAIRHQLTDVDIVFLKDPLPLFSDKTIDLFFINDVKLAPPEATGVFICGGKEAL
jgi:hypothetical protein